MSNTAKATISLNAKPFEAGASAAVKAAEAMSKNISSAMSTALGVIGGGVGTGLMGVLDESKRQTRLQEQMVGLLQGSQPVQGAAPSQTLTFGY